ncbi:pyridoxal phosphate enzyme, YggS family [Thermanaerovibrio velox DSM 12556]|uniref:Pyridoxal phosphate homeostasis protein n=1 Tax=Thermanaerovibrio velox DSM 12556 TaxID=926567 RepID=H0UQ31_9BACT|nr:YggS family pyridoxal phosphate-dependent enzyme [Thermanaerovibrio velox]EHM09660.1 pyridoxal phosphate enzyme, YggS family [Thermanaerovibrio velox DSM 12556]
MVNDYSHLKDNLRRALDAIGEAASQAHRDPSEVRVVAVTKNHPPEAVRAAFQAGISLIGENRVQEALAKRGELEDLDVTWLMIGHLQRNKVRKALEVFHQVHSLDSMELALALNRVLSEGAGEGRRPPLPVLLEVNVSGEAAKHGVMPQGALQLAETVLERCPMLDLKGLMCVGPLTEDEREIRSAFASLREIRDRLEERLLIELPELSMGMSSDFHLAVMEGSTMVRLGTCLFGPRGVF